MDSENSYWSLNMEDNNTGAEDESEVSPNKGTIIKKKGSTKIPSSSVRKSRNNTEDDSSDKEEEIEDIPKKRGRPKGSQNKDRKGKLIKTYADVLIPDTLTTKPTFIHLPFLSLHFRIQKNDETKRAPKETNRKVTKECRYKTESPN